MTRDVRYFRHSQNPSCGCAATEAKRKNGRGRRIHGLTKGSEIDRKLYDVYRQMQRRCYNASSKDYPAWGGRGIKVCDTWLNDVFAFRDWAASSGYRVGVTIERRDNNAGYSPENCTWIPNERQAKNTRRIRWIEARGKRLSATDWAIEVGMPYRRLMSRLNMGWDAERALTP